MPDSTFTDDPEVDTFLTALARDLLEQAFQQNRGCGMARPRLLGLVPGASLGEQAVAYIGPGDLPLFGIVDLNIPPAFFDPHHPARHHVLAQVRALLSELGALGTLSVVEAWAVRGEDAAQADEQGVRPVDHAKRRSILQVRLEVEAFHLTLVKDLDSGEIEEQRAENPWDDLEDKLTAGHFCLPLGQFTNLSGCLNALYNRAVYAWFKGSGEVFPERFLHGCLAQIAGHGGASQLIGSIVGACADAEGVDRAWLRETSWRLLEPRVTHADRILQEHGRKPIWAGRMEHIWEGALEQLPLEETLRRNPGLAEAMGYANTEDVQTRVQQELERNPGGFYG